MIESKGGKTTIRINQIDIINARFSMINKLKNRISNGIEFSNLHLSGINGTIKELLVYEDTTSFTISGLSFTESKDLGYKS
jgi:hypothetical protein